MLTGTALGGFPQLGDARLQIGDRLFEIEIGRHLVARLGARAANVNARGVGQRVAGIDQLDQPAAVDMGVDLRGGDVGMAEQHLQCAQIGAAFEQMRGEGVAQYVRTDLRSAGMPASAASSRSNWYSRTR